MNTIKRAFKQICNFVTGRKIKYSTHEYEGPYKEPERKRRRSKPKMRGYDGTMYGPFRSRQGGW